MNRQLSRRDFLRLSAGLAASAAVVACGPRPEGGGTTSGTPAKHDTLRLWMAWPEEYAACDYIKKNHFPEFKTLHPELSAELTYVDWSETTRRFVETKAAGVPPDVV